MRDNMKSEGGMHISDDGGKSLKKGFIKYGREKERAFFFYATLAMFILYILMKALGD